VDASGKPYTYAQGMEGDQEGAEAGAAGDTSNPWAAQQYNWESMQEEDFCWTDGIAPKCDRRTGNIVFVEELQVNKISPTISINVMVNSKAEYRPFINVTTQNVMGTWLYDTGASVSCMSLEQFRRIAIGNRPVKQNLQIRLLSAVKIEINIIGLF